MIADGTDPMASGAMASGVSASMEKALFERRIVLVSGAIDVERAGVVAAALMTLDALGDDPAELRISADSDSLDAAFAVMDTIDVLGVEINATVVGAVAGTAVGIVAVCARRRIGASGRIHLREPRSGLAGVATEIERQAADLEQRTARFVHRLAEATGRPFEHLEADMRAGRYLDAEQAVAYGLVDEVVGKDSGIRPT